MTAKLDKSDLFVYGAMGLSMLALLAFRGGDLLQGIANQSAIARTSQIAAKDNAVAQQRFSDGCNTEIIMQNGSPILTAGMVVLDARTRQPLPPGAVVCDSVGATAIVGANGTPDDIRTSANVKRVTREQGLGVQ